MLQVAFKAEVALAAIRRAIRLMDDMTPIYTDIAEYMLGATKDRFQTSTMLKVPDCIRRRMPRDRQPPPQACFH